MAVLGVGIGGSGIKGAPVDTDRGELVGERYRVKTPATGRPDEVVACLGAVIEHHGWTGRVGVTFPGVVRDGARREPVLAVAPRRRRWHREEGGPVAAAAADEGAAGGRGARQPRRHRRRSDDRVRRDARSQRAPG